MRPDVREQFGRVAELYATSQVHAHGRDLDIIVRLAGPQSGDLVLDVSTGAGHTALALAAHVRRVVAADITPEMLAVARRLAAVRSSTNVELCQADVRALPFMAGSFDLVTCRTAAHHYPRLDEALREFARVLRPGGRLVVSDTVAPDDEVADRFINAVEALRDPTHVRDWSLAEWRAAFAGAGLRLETTEQLDLELDFESWVERSATPPELREVLALMLTRGPARFRTLFKVRVNPLRFCLPKAVFLAVRD